MCGKIIPALLSRTAVFLRTISSFEKSKFLMWWCWIHSELGFLLLAISWVCIDTLSTVLHQSNPNYLSQNFTFISMTWFGFGIFLLLSIPSLNSPSVHSHTLLPHLFHKASPINPFITHSVIISNLRLAGTDRHWNKKTKAQSLFSRTSQKGREIFE